MSGNPPLGETNNNLVPDKNHAQILIESQPTSRNIEQVKEIIETEGVYVIETKPFSARWTLFILNVQDMRNIALKLIYRGFNVKGVNALLFSKENLETYAAGKQKQ
jgi:predicted nuclease with RNAse H fold